MKPPPLPEQFILTTSDSIEGKAISKYLGPVSGFSAKNHGIKGAFRLSTDRIELDSYSTLVSDTQQAAVEHLLQKAKSAGADAVIAMRMDFELNDGICVASSYGTAVALK